MTYQVAIVPLDQIEFNPRQPRRDAEATDLASLAASLGDGDLPQFAQLPVVYPTDTGQYRVQAGERRLRSAHLRGFKTVPVLVLAASATPRERQRLTLLENLHRAELSVIDEAIGLKAAYLYDNAVAMGLAAEADTLLDRGPSAFAVVQQMQALLDDNGWKRTSPAVDWQTCLTSLGLTINKQALMRRLYVLNLDTAIIAQLLALSAAGVALTEASIRVIGKLEVVDQQYLLDAITATPDIVNKIRRICSKVGDGTYTIREAVAEARGEVYIEPLDAPSDLLAGPVERSVADPDEQDDATDIAAETPAQTAAEPVPRAADPPPVTDADLDQAVQIGDHVMTALALLDDLADTLAALSAISTPPLAEPWGAILHTTITTTLPALRMWATTDDTRA